MKNYLLLCALAGSSLFAETSCAYLPSSLKTDETNVYTKVSYLYWQCVEKGLDFAIKNTGPQTNSDLSVHQIGFDWKSAFRIMLGTYLPIDHWKIDLTYSLFYHEKNNRVNHNFNLLSEPNFGEGILSVWTSPGAFLTENIYARWQNATAQWKIHANFFDLLIRHDLMNGKSLSFQPAWGLKMAIIQQRFNVAYAPGNYVYIAADPDPEILSSSDISMKNRSFNIGPCFGCSTKWSLPAHFSFFGSLSGALLASHFDVGRHELDVSTTTATQLGSYRINDDFWTYLPQGTLVFGLEWGNYSSPKHSFYYGFSASYEAEYWWKQNMLLRHYDGLIAASPNVAHSQGDLFFQGLTLDAFFAF